MSEYKKIIVKELENILNLLDNSEPPYFDINEFINVLNYKLSPEAKAEIKKFLHE